MFETLRKSYTRLFIALALLSSAQLRPAAGDLDPSFGTGGVDTEAVNSASGANAVDIQADGKIVAGGFSTIAPLVTVFTVARYGVNGGLDATFNGTGIVTTTISVTSLINGLQIQPADQKIVVGGASGVSSSVTDFTLARYNTNGSLDGTFGSGGITTTAIGATSVINDIALQADGKIVAAGNSSASLISASRVTLARYTTAGVLDTATFNPTGAGSGQPGVVVLNASLADTANDVVIQPDGKIVIAGSSTLVGGVTEFLIARFNTDGSIDTTFGGNGTGYISVPIVLAGAIGDIANALDLQPDGKIVVAGTSLGTSVTAPFVTVNRFALVRLNTDGTVDTTFGTNGRVVTQINTSSIANDVVVQPDGKIVAGGQSTVGALIGGTIEFALARYLTTGALDPSFGTGGITTTPINIAASINSLALDDCRRIVAAGISGTTINPLTNTDVTTFTLARYQGDNTAPVANNVSAITSLGAPVVITLSGSDADGDTLTFAIVTGPTNGTLSAITQISPTSAQVTYTPTGAYVGPDSFTFSVTDCAGATSATPGTVSVTVSSAPATRPTANPTSATVPENVPTTITLTGSDPDGLPLTFNIVTDPAHGTLGTITQTSPTSADVVYAPNPNYVGPDSFTFSVTSANGTSDPAAVSINVVPSDIPAAIPQTVALNENTPVTIILVGVDPNGLPLNFIITSLPANGTLSGFIQLTPTTAQVIYTPNNEFIGVDGFTFVVNNGTNTSAPALVTLIVVENASPIVLGIISKYC